MNKAIRLRELSRLVTKGYRIMIYSFSIAPMYDRSEGPNRFFKWPRLYYMQSKDTKIEITVNKDKDINFYTKNFGLLSLFDRSKNIRRFDKIAKRNFK